MDRIDTSTKATDLFGAGKHGFRNGDLANSIPPTDLNAEWFNQVQEEVAGAVESSGQALSELDLTQLTKAIRRFAGANLTAVANGVTNLTASQAGLVIVDATAGNVTLNLPAASVVAGLPVAFSFYRVDATANTIAINRAGADTIDGATSAALAGQYSYLTLRSDGGTRWATLSRPAAGAGSYAGVDTYATSQVLNSAHVGRVVEFSGASANRSFTLPAVGTVPAGSVIVIKHRSTGGHVLSVLRAGADNILAGTSTITTFNMVAGDNALLVASAAGWILAGGSCSLHYAIGAPLLGVNQLYTSLGGGSRVTNTTYTNTTNRPIFVSVTINGAVATSVSMLVNGVAIGVTNTDSNYPPLICAVVPPGSTYRVNTTAGLLSWFELS